jgi:GTPase Era involved in 16S rRNA processing
LRNSLSQSMQIARDSIKPVVEAAMDGMAAQARLMHERMVAATGQALTQMAASLHSEWQQTSTQTLAQQQHICNALTQTAQQVSDSAQTNAAKTLGEISKLMASSEELVRARIATEAQWSAQHGQRMEQLSATLRTELGALRAEEAVRGGAAVDRLSALQTALTQHLTTLGTALEEPITRLIQTASEAPRAAAEVIGQLRQEISHSLARDNALLEERSRIMETLNTLLAGINHASLEQRSVIDTLVASSAVSLERAAEQFAEKVDAEATKLADVAALVSSSSVEVASLGETFHFAVRSFNEGNEKLIANLQRIEGAMDKSMARSDEQLAYYVAQAREVIDLSTMSQKEIVEELRQLAVRQAMLAPEAA